MKVFLKLLQIAAVISLLSSCTKIVYIGRRVDPEIILDKEHHNIVFVNVFDYTSPSIVKARERLPYHNGVMGLLEGLSSFSNDTSYTLILGDSLKKGIDKSLLTTLLPLDTVKTVCSRYNCNLLLSLDSLSLFFNWHIDTIRDNSGYRQTVRNFYLSGNFFLSLYNSAGDLINRSEVDQSQLFRSRPPSFGNSNFQPALARGSIEAGSLAVDAGQDYVAKFYPQLVRETKQLFSGSAFKESNDYIFAKNWNKAIDLLEQLSKNQDSNIAEKARHNLEIVREARVADSGK